MQTRELVSIETIILSDRLERHNQLFYNPCDSSQQVSCDITLQ